jgi:hypothetical protein
MFSVTDSLVQNVGFQALTLMAPGVSHHVQSGGCMYDTAGKVRSKGTTKKVKVVGGWIILK